MLTNRPIRTALAWSIAFGASFGLLFRISAAFNWFPHPQGATAVMSLSYLLIGSTAIGYWTVWCAEMKVKRPIWQWIVVPWCSALLVIVGAAVFFLEGAICLVFALPILMVFSSLGGVIAGVLRRKARSSTSVHLCMMALPLFLPQLETCCPAPLQIRTVHSEVKIASSASIVWKNIASVTTIRPEELPNTWTQRLGFPRPIAATLSHEGVGGVRNATFEGGLSFREKVTVWQPQRRLAFTIKADTAHIPATTLDRHATIGGPYFDVLTGKYQIQTVGASAVILHLTSQERLTTDFNGYAGLWTDGVMRSIQGSILEVIKQRCESSASVLFEGQ